MAHLLRIKAGHIVFSLTLMVLQPVYAASILDQSFEGPFTDNAFNTELYRAQTFTVGVSGLLTDFEVYMFSRDGGTSEFEIWNTVGGEPEPIRGTALASATISFGVGEEFVGADISSFGLNVTTGDLLAIVQIGDSSTGTGAWRGNRDGGYDGGEVFSTIRSDPSGAWTDTLTGDFGFRTYVAAIPIPSAVWLFSSGLLGLIGISRRKKAA